MICGQEVLPGEPQKQTASVNLSSITGRTESTAPEYTHIICQDAR